MWPPLHGRACRSPRRGAEPDTRGLATVLLLGYSDLPLPALAEPRSPCPNASASKYKLSTRSTLNDQAAAGPGSCLTLTMKGDERKPPVSLGEALIGAVTPCVQHRECNLLPAPLDPPIANCGCNNAAQGRLMSPPSISSCEH
ncbi:hypothetical protein AAES_06502 [Amazona aestiva]|uniref:Uncharacterized protein n=1 Tax=Amazona aestiva TaxID=12930 RepID=A0A0Q3XBN6_AMAAE|nr:hypothetical protein AAES_06502 [Amazona aestiva]